MSTTTTINTKKRCLESPKTLKEFFDVMKTQHQDLKSCVDEMYECEEKKFSELPANALNLAGEMRNHMRDAVKHMGEATNICMLRGISPVSRAEMWTSQLDNLIKALLRLKEKGLEEQLDVIYFLVHGLGETFACFPQHFPDLDHTEEEEEEEEQEEEKKETEPAEEEEDNLYHADGSIKTPFAAPEDFAPIAAPMITTQFRIISAAKLEELCAFCRLRFHFDEENIRRLKVYLVKTDEKTYRVDTATFKLLLTRLVRLTCRDNAFLMSLPDKQLLNHYDYGIYLFTDLESYFEDEEVTLTVANI